MVLQLVPCAIALGSNLGDPYHTLVSAMDRLDAMADIQVTARSPLYQTAPVGPPQPDYLNACVTLLTALPPQDLLHRLLGLEADYGRVRQERWGARTLDLDIILYDDQIVAEDFLHLPHPRFRERAFVLVPLADIAPDWIDPITGQTIQTLCQGVEGQGVERYPLPNSPAGFA